MEFAKKHQLEARQDEAGNVLITKPATPGKEQTPGCGFTSTYGYGL